MAIDGFTCKQNVKPVEDWVQDQNAKQCPVCVLRPTAEYYMGILQKANRPEQLKKLEEAWSSQEVLTIARTMDRIKAEVGEDLKKDLITIDCFAQSFEPE